MLHNSFLFSGIRIRHYFIAQLSNLVKTKVLLVLLHLKSFLASSYFLLPRINSNRSSEMIRFWHSLVFSVSRLWRCGLWLPVCITRGAIPPLQGTGCCLCALQPVDVLEHLCTAQYRGGHHFKHCMWLMRSYETFFYFEIWTCQWPVQPLIISLNNSSAPLASGTRYKCPKVLFY